MTKQEYLKRLEELLISNNISNYQEIVDKYDKRFSIAEDAKMSVEDTISRLGKPEEVVKQILESFESKTSNDSINDNGIKHYRIVIKEAIFDNIIMKKINTGKVIVKVDDDIVDYIKLHKDGNSLTINKNSNFDHFARIKRGDITIEIGDNIYFDELSIDVVDTDITICEIVGNNISINNISGDTIIRGIKANKTAISSVSGDVCVKKFHSNKVVISQVSGDASLQGCNIQNGVFSTVSGDMDIRGKIETKKCHSVSGDININ